MAFCRNCSTIWSSTRAAVRRSASSRSAVRLRSVKNFCCAQFGGLRQIDLAVLQALDQFFRSEVDEDDVVGVAQHGVRHRLAHDDAGDARDDVGEAFEMLDVERRPDIDARVEQFLDILPAFRMPAFGRVGVREFVDDDELRAGASERRRVEFLESCALIGDDAARQDLEPFESAPAVSARPCVSTSADDDVDAFVASSAAGALQHGVGLADARRRAEEDEQAPRVPCSASASSASGSGRPSRIRSFDKHAPEGAGSARRRFYDGSADKALFCNLQLPALAARFAPTILIKSLYRPSEAEWKPYGAGCIS